MEHALLHNLVKDLGPYDRLDLLASAGALQLVPENADRTVRLEALAHAAASLSQEGSRPKISTGRLKAMCTGKPLGDGPIALSEDPFDNPFTESFTFSGGSFVVFPGTAEESTFILRHLSDAIFLQPEAFPHNAFLRQVHGVLGAVLLISNRIAERAGLSRGTEPASVEGGEVAIPQAQRFEQLKEAVRFHESELAALLAKQSISRVALDDLCVDSGAVSPGQYTIENGPLFARPIVRAERYFVVALPGMLTSAARHIIIRLAHQNGVVHHLVDRYNAAVWETVKESLRYLRNDVVPLRSPPTPSISGVRDGFFNLDADKVIYALVITDSLAKYDPRSVFTQWCTGALAQQVNRRLHLVQQYLTGLKHPPNDALFIVLVQGAGRWYAFGLGKPDRAVCCQCLLGSAADLETMAFAECGDPLALWKYAQASTALRQGISVQASSVLDEFYHYRHNRHSFYLSDDRRPNRVVFAPGGAGELRREVLRQRDFHAAPSCGSGGVIEVAALYDPRNVPIYVPRRRTREHVKFLVEGFPLPIWVVAAQSERQQPALSRLRAQFSDAIAYWLWQCSTRLARILEPLTSKYHCLQIDLRLLDHQAWYVPSQLAAQSVETPVQVHVERTSGRLHIDLDAGVALLLEGPDNRGERVLMEHVLGGFRELLPDCQRKHLSDKTIVDILNHAAPLGRKKKLVILNTNTAPELDDRGLPRYRLIQDADEDELLDELGAHLKYREGGTCGPIEGADRTTVLNKVVDFYYHSLQGLIASLRPHGLLEWLVAYQEAITNEAACHELTIPTRLECFSSEPEMLKDLPTELSERARAAIASRFVIEYVVAQPPNGLRPISLSVYDRLQALAWHIINWACDSDLIHFDLADFKLNILPSGRLGAHRGQYESGLDAFSHAFAAGTVARTIQGFAHHWKKGGSRPSRLAKQFSQLDAAAPAEFGHSLSELMKFMSAASAMGSDLDPVVPKLRLECFVERMAQSLSWSNEKVTSALELLCLKQRAKFLQPPTPFAEQDVFPWRFNRALSYLRRPFLHLHLDNNVEVLWGPRHVVRASKYLVGLCMSGRLKARSDKMRAVLGAVGLARGEAFNSKVADLLRRDLSLRLKQRVKRIGNLTPPGEIDVLVADPRHRRLHVIECKDLTMARTPRELHRELSKLFRGSTKKRPAIGWLQEKARWCKANLNEVLHYLEVISKSNWEIVPLLIVSQEIISAHLWSSPVRILSFTHLENQQLT